MPEDMPEDMPDRMPEDLPVRKCINVMVGITRSKVIIIFKQYIQKNFKIFNALDCVARFHPGLGDFSPLITSIK